MRNFTATDPPRHIGKSDVWLTPLDLIEKIGQFDLDPCAFPGHPTAKKLICLPEDGLSAKWSGKVWLNPPYSEAEIWLEKLRKHRHGMALVFSRTGTKYMQRFLWSADCVVFIKGRVKFINSETMEAKTNAGADSMLLCWGCEPQTISIGAKLRKCELLDLQGASK